jgi:hypothetical protein
MTEDRERLPVKLGSNRILSRNLIKYYTNIQLGSKRFHVVFKRMVL